MEIFSKNNDVKPVVNERMKLILHIPHSSTVIPCLEGYLLPKNDIEEEIIRLTDWYTDDLFDSASDIKIIAPFSRIFCDVERFTDDNREVMAKYGMGVLYEKTDDGRLLRSVSKDLRRKVLSAYYHMHHLNFEKAVSDQLASTGIALIIDCHSFPDIPMKRDLDQDRIRPDFCIGTDHFHTPQWLTDFTLDYFSRKGYSIMVNKPYAGSIVPLSHYGIRRNVMSVMIEINRKLYLREEPGKSKGYGKAKELITGYLGKVRSLIINPSEQKTRIDGKIQ